MGNYAETVGIPQKPNMKNNLVPKKLMIDKISSIQPSLF